jgi:hypothetical protein
MPDPETESGADLKPDATQDTTPLRPGEFDPLGDDEVATGAITAADAENVPTENHRDKPKGSVAQEVLRVLSLSEVLGYEPPPGSFLVGDGVIELGGDSLLYGPPGSFKGFAVGELMACGARGYGEWLGFPVNTQFASLWLNFENRRRRLKTQFAKMDLPPNAEDFIFVTDIPGVWSLADVRLAGRLRQTIEEKKIKLLIVDTVSCLVEDEMAKHFAAFFVALNAMLHGLEPRPAVLLVHHSRKPKEGDKGARALLNLISGHQTLQRRARSICYLGRITEEFDERRVVAVWLKVSDSGEAEGRKTALQLGDSGTLEEIQNFDWSEWQGATSGGNAKREPRVKEAHILQLFDYGRRRMTRKQAAEELEVIAGVKRSAAYDALKLNGRFASLLAEDPSTGLIGLKSGNSSNAHNAE